MNPPVVSQGRSASARPVSSGPVGPGGVAAARGEPRAWRVALRRCLEPVRHQWHPVVVPGLVLWAAAAYVGASVLHPIDIAEYQRYAHGALASPLLHRFPNEYPAPALAVFLLPLVLPMAYPWAFAVVAGIVLLALLVSYGTSGVPGLDTDAARRLIVYLALGAVLVLTARYDIFAAAAAFWSVRAARQSRWSGAWNWSSVGFVLKVFPVALWPVLLIGEWRATGRVPLRRLWWMAGSLVAVGVLPALFDPGAVANVAHYYLQRPAEIGSLPASLTVLVDRHGWQFNTGFHSLNIVSPMTGLLAALTELAAAVGCAWVWWAQARNRIPLEAAGLATLTLVVLGGKVLSVQYLIWLMPLWALYRVRVSWALASVANMFPFSYSEAATRVTSVHAHEYVTAMALIYVTRDLLIGVGTVLWLRRVLVGHERRGPDRTLAPAEARTRQPGVLRSAKSMAFGSLRATTHPPKPAPVSRAP